jgi:hypothetical protein
VPSFTSKSCLLGCGRAIHLHDGVSHSNYKSDVSDKAIDCSRYPTHNQQLTMQQKVFLGIFGLLLIGTVSVLLGLTPYRHERIDGKVYRVNRYTDRTYELQGGQWVRIPGADAAPIPAEALPQLIATGSHSGKLRFSLYNNTEWSLSEVQVEVKPDVISPEEFEQARQRCEAETKKKGPPRLFSDCFHLKSGQPHVGAQQTRTYNVRLKSFPHQAVEATANLAWKLPRWQVKNWDWKIVAAKGIRE